MDLTDLPGAPFAVDSLASELGGIDVLVNCSGTGTGGMALMGPQAVQFVKDDAWRSV
jgi:NAD(P)-dependent dehydrogenase (short-subunit alcohol dehydrogenase family)